MFDFIKKVGKSLLQGLLKRMKTIQHPRTTNLDTDLYGPLPRIQFSSPSFPNLPTEIWMRILSFVVRILILYFPKINIVDYFILLQILSSPPAPGLADGFGYGLDTANNSAATPNGVESLGSPATDGTLALRLTCRAFRALVLPMVLARIELCCTTQAARIAGFLEKNSRRGFRSGQGDDAHLLIHKSGQGIFVREIVCSRHERTPCVHDGQVPLPVLEDRDAFHDAVVRVIRHTPRLAIYRNRNVPVRADEDGRGVNTQWTPSRIIEALATHCAESLQCLEWCGTEFPAWTDLKILLCQTPNLRALAVQSMPFARRHEAESDKGLRCNLRYLQDLRLGQFIESVSEKESDVVKDWHEILEFLLLSPDNHARGDRLPASAEPFVHGREFTLPALQSLAITPATLSLEGTLSPTIEDRFLSLYGPQIRSLRICKVFPGKNVPDSYIRGGDPAALLRRVLEICPQLHTLSISPLMLIPAYVQGGNRATPLPGPTLSHPTLARVGIFPPIGLNSIFLRRALSIHMRVDMLLASLLCSVPVKTLANSASSFLTRRTHAFPELRVVHLHDVNVLSIFNSRWIDPGAEPDFLDWGSDFALVMGPGWVRYWLERLSERGIRFEESHGTRWDLLLAVFAQGMETLPDGV